MKEFEHSFKSIFSGLFNKLTNRKTEVSVSECHNLEPVEEDYATHELVIDMNTAGYDWGNPDNIDAWVDHEDENWIDDNNENWTDH